LRIVRPRVAAWSLIAAAFCTEHEKMKEVKRQDVRERLIASRAVGGRST
jgi:hypothetical protein